MKTKIWFLSDLLLDSAPETELFKEWKDVVYKDDGVVLLGNIASNNKAFWFNHISTMPGEKVLFCGNLETNRIKWYHKFGFSGVVAFKESKVLATPNGKVLVSHLPAFESLLDSTDGKYRGWVSKLGDVFDMNSCILNIHGHTLGKGTDRHNTFDVSYRPGIAGPKMLNLEQILHLKFKG